MNNVDYKEILKANMIPLMTRLIDSGHTMIFQHDNATIHSAKAVTTWLETQNFRTLVWPPQSPDLNLIENIWARMKVTIDERYPGSRPVASMKEVIKVVWGGLDAAYLEPYFDSMPARMQAVIDVKGGSTRY